MRNAARIQDPGDTIHRLGPEELVSDLVPNFHGGTVAPPKQA